VSERNLSKGVTDSPLDRKFSRQLSPGKIYPATFWNAGGIVDVNSVPRVSTVSVPDYSNLPHKDVTTDCSEE
jgi:hypothetical protein